MILADTTVWIDHFRGTDGALAARLIGEEIVVHPHVIGELALGSLGNRRAVLRLLGNLPVAPAATGDEVLAMIEGRRLWSLGIGYTDAHLLASASLDPGLKLWTRDRRLHDVAQALGLAHAPA